MPPLTEIPHGRVRFNDWTNYSGTLNKKLPMFCSLDRVAGDGMMRAHADAIRGVLRYCFAQNPPLKLRVVGSGWSFSNVLSPDQVMLDLGNMGFMDPIAAEHLTERTRARAHNGLIPMYVEGGVGIADVNDRLGNSWGLALQTSGAGDGHRMGGCIATGTHGSAMGIGALHDTVLAMHLVVSPDQALLVQPETDQPFDASLAQWLEAQTGIPTRNVVDDAQFHAAQVSLGSLGVVFGVILETTQLYRFKIHKAKYPDTNADVWKAISTGDTKALHPVGVNEVPYHFDVIMHPYPTNGVPSRYVTLMWKTGVGGAPFHTPDPGIPRQSSDVMRLIAELVHLNHAAPLLTRDIIRPIITSQLNGDMKPDDTLFPGEVFGPTTLPAGRGASTELAVDRADAVLAIDTVYEVLNDLNTIEKARFLLGVIAARFVPKTKALLGMNQFDMTCHIELPSVGTDEVQEIYKAIWDALEKKNVRFTCHWGQQQGLNPARVEKYFGPNARAWQKARRALLVSDVAMHVFESALLKDVGLDGDPTP